MQKNKILLLILLGLGISLELVLGLYLLKRSTARNTGVSKLSTRATLVSTIAVQFLQANAGLNDNNNNGLYPAPGLQDTGQTGTLDPTQAALTAQAGNQAAALNGGAIGVAGGATNSGGTTNSGGAIGNGGAFNAPGYPVPGQSQGAAANYSGPPPASGGVNYDHSLPNLNSAWLVDTLPAGTATVSGTPLAGSTATLAAATQAAATATRAAGAAIVPTSTAAAGTTVPPAATATPALSRIAKPSPTPVPPTPTSPASRATATSAPIPAAQALVSIPVASPPQIDGTGSDPAWSAAPALVISTSGGANQSATRVTARSVYAQGRVYFLLTWADATQSYLLNPWEKQPSGGWAQLSGADRYATDQIALAWATASHAADFIARGCDGLCLAGAPLAATSGQTDDLWQWSPVRDVGQVDDLYLDGTGAHPDPSTGGGYAENVTRNGKGPQYMPPGGGDKTGAPGYILDAAKVPLDASLFQPGDRVPSIITAPFSGDRGDISAAWGYASGAWTLEISRKLVTGSADDVQFADLGRSYPFALGTFDNTLANHAAQSGASLLTFQP